MKKWLFAGLLITLAIMISACGSNETETGNNGGNKDTNEEKLTLVVWDWLSGDATSGPGKHFDDIDKKYMADNPHITIERLAQPADKYYDILKPALLSQSGPDIFLLHDVRPTEYIDFITPLNDLMPSESQDNLVGLNLFSVNNNIVAYPIGLQGNIWYYNKQKFTEAGLDPEQTPSTWEELVSMMDIMKEKGITPVAVGDKEGEFIGNWLFSMNLANELRLDEIMALSNGELLWTDERVQMAYQQSADLFLKEYSQNSALTTAIYPDNGEVFKRGETAMTIGLLADVLNWKEFGDTIGLDNLGVFINPARADAPHQGTIYADPGIGFSINKTSKYAEAASNYLAYVTNADNLGEYYKVTGTLPNNKLTDTSIIDNPLAKEIFTIATTSKLSTQALARTRVNIKEAFVQGSQKVLFGKQTVEEFLAEVQSTVEK